jgi:predicted metal-dependent hydrolase
VDDILDPSTRRVHGCDELPPQLLRQGIAQFNAGHYWECHETLEALWRSETRPVRDLYQGILQVGVAFHHLRAGNHPGTVKVLRRGLLRLDSLPEVCQGVCVAELSRAARAIYEQVVELGPNHIEEFDLMRLPHIELTDLGR